MSLKLYKNHFKCWKEIKPFSDSSRNHTGRVEGRRHKCKMRRTNMSFLSDCSRYRAKEIKGTSPRKQQTLHFQRQQGSGGNFKRKNWI